MRARVFVTLKKSVFDPQGKTIHEALRSMGYSTVADVRQGKFIEIDLAEEDPAAAQFVSSVNRGNRTVPTVKFADGSTLTNPNAAQVRQRLTEMGAAS